MTRSTLTLKEVAGQMVWKGVPLSVQAVRYRIEKARRAGYKIEIRKAKSPRGRMVDGLSQQEVQLLCKLWKNLHV